MNTRTTTSKVTFNNPFRIGDVDRLFPAGVYDVETDEELLGSLSIPAYRRTTVRFSVPADTGQKGTSHTFVLDPEALDLALERDKVGAENSELE